MYSKVKQYIKLLEKYSNKKVIFEDIESEKNQIVEYLQNATNNIEDLIYNYSQILEYTGNYPQFEELENSLNKDLQVIEQLKDRINNKIKQTTMLNETR